MDTMSVFSQETDLHDAAPQDLIRLQTYRTNVAVTRTSLVLPVAIFGWPFLHQIEFLVPSHYGSDSNGRRDSKNL